MDTVKITIEVTYDKELDVLNQLFKILSHFDPRTAERMLRYLVERNNERKVLDDLGIE